MKKCLMFLILLTLLPVPSLAETGAHRIEQRSVPVYCTDLQDWRSAEEMVLIPDYPLYYVDGVKDLPYVELSDFVDLVNKVDTFDSRDPFGAEPEAKEDYACSADEDGVFVCAYQPQQSQVIIDFNFGTLTYTCMDTFGKDPA